MLSGRRIGGISLGTRIDLLRPFRAIRSSIRPRQIHVDAILDALTRKSTIEIVYELPFPSRARGDLRPWCSVAYQHELKGWTRKTDTVTAGSIHTSRVTGNAASYTLCSTRAP